jgi:uncharacterized protein YndB with AHSA1/START domain
MKTKNIEKNITINSSKEKVWNVLFSDDTYLIWAAEFGQDSYAETDWKKGSKALFKGKDGSGIVGHITELVEPDFLAIEYDGLINSDGSEDLESEEALVFKGKLETDTLVESDGVTELDIVSGMSEEYFEMMDKAWDKALLKVKELSEK